MAFPADRPARCFAAAAFTFALMASRGALADGGFPRAHEIFLEPGNADHILVRSDYWGLFHSLDGGKTWEYSCSELFGGGSKQITRQSTLYLPGGRTLVATFDGMRITDDFCDWRTVPSLAGHPSRDFAVTGTSIYTLVTDNVDGGISSAMYRSTDNGDTWSAVTTTFPSGFIAQTIRIAPSNAQRMYVGGVTIGAAPASVLVSSDGGATWTETHFSPPAQITWTVRVRAISPTNPDVAFVWVDTEDFDNSQPDWIWATSDAGNTWKMVYTGQQDLPGLALSPDGTQVLVSGKGDSLMGTTVASALATGQSAFQKVFDGQVWGLTWTSDALYAGNNNFTAAGIPAFTLGRSTDSGATFSPLMSICDVTFGTCGETSTQEGTCHPPFDGPGGLEIDFLQSSRCTAPPAAPAKKASSSGCAVPRENERPSWPAAWGAGFLLALGGYGWRRRRRS